MFRNHKDDIDPGPDQNGVYTAPKSRFKNVDGLLAQQFTSAHEKPQLKILNADDALAYFESHTETRMRLAEEQRQFMKELKPEILELLMKKNMPVIGVFVGGKIVSGCAVLYPSDKDIADYLPGYDFHGQEEKTAVISAVFTHPDHGGKGYSKMAIDLGMGIAVMEGKEFIRAKVDKQNAVSLAIFDGFAFDTKVEGQDSRKVYPLLAL